MIFVFLYGEILSVIGLLVGILIMVAYFTLLERKAMANMQRRYGPNYVGLFGILQPLADGLKLLRKMYSHVYSANLWVYYLSPCFLFISSLFLWALLPLEYGYVSLDSNYSFFWYLCISSVGVYSVLFSGLFSKSRYGLLGSIRGGAQFISYEICLSVVYILIFNFVGSLRIIDVIYLQDYIWLFFPLNLLAIFFFFFSLIEANRVPFDLAEAESELVSGYNVEYAGMWFALFFLGEYASILVLSAFMVILFYGNLVICGVYSFFFFLIKLYVLLFTYIWFRSSYPRIRYDQMLYMCWIEILPALMILAFVYFFIFYFWY